MNEEFDDDRDRDDPSQMELGVRVDAFPPGPVDSTLLAEDLARDAAVSLMRHKVGQVDRAVGRAMEQVPVPVGLAERLLSDMQLAEGRRRVGRRRWLVSGSVAAALAAGVAWFWLSTAAPPMDYDTLIAEVRDFHDQVPPPAEGASLAEASPQTGYLCPSAVATNARTRWRPVRHLLGRAGLAYALTGARGKRATLYVIDLKSWTRPMVAAGLPTSPPPGRFTFGRTTGAWTDGTLLFVLVVEGDEGDYHSFLRRQDRMA
ncbi:MAG TPA: hypothetical protein VMV69_00355 [Pirellulales bacterium]|nr:hypothetical protein [Pirellulales bacterium]